jgi:hypothetical protein
MEIINFFECKNHYEAIQKEQEYFLSLNATLNSIEPYAILKPKEPIIENTIIKEILYCKECNKHFNNKKLLDTHNNTNKHIKKRDSNIKINNTQKSLKISKKFLCEICDYSTSKISDYNKHLLTTKHINTTKYNNVVAKNAKEYKCECGKQYNHRSSLFNHQKICKNRNVPILLDESNICQEVSTLETDNNNNNNMVQLLIKENSDFKNMIMELVKNNSDLQKQMIDVCQKIQPGTINNINSHNKTFNLQVFLNEECKNAMNMSEFINSLQLKLSDLENIGKIGYIEGMTNIIIKQLNGTDTYIRPVHCSDLKREILYIKEENKWEKEGPDNKKMKNALRHIEQKNFKMLNEWQAKHPHFKECTSSENDTYLQIVSNATNGTAENMNKVIKKVLKNVVIEKNVM